MKNAFKLSTIALLAAIIAAAPASAVSLNLGGNGPLLDVNGNGTDSEINVGTGDLLGGTGGGSGINGLLDINGDDDSTTALLDLNGTGSNGIIDFDGSGDLIDLTGNDEIVNLGGNTAPTTARIGLGGSNDALLLNLFGEDDASAALNLETAGIGGIGGIGGGTGDNDVVLDLFGTDGGGSGNGGAGAGGNGGEGGNGGMGLGGGNVSGNGLLVASLDDNTECFMPSAAQIGNLVNRHAYTPATLSGWTNARNMKVVEVGLCNEAKARVAAGLAADANIGRLQSHLNSIAVIRAGLNQRGHTPSDVIAIDKNGDTLIVYVI